VVRVEARRVRHSIAITLVALLGGAAAIVSVVSVAFYVPVIVLFGRDDPAQTLAGYLSAIAVPIIALALVIASLVWSLQLLRRKRDAAAVLVAAFVCVAMVCAGVQLRPH
jgi:NADH:ubiquinone oxidoreductase subunit 2 (subunit N)